MTNFIKYTSLALLLLITTMNFASNKTKKEKTGILLVAFGSSYPETRETFKNIESEVQKAFPNIDIRWAYTSKFIRKKLNKRGEHIDSPTLALAKMSEEGFTHIAVQSLHVIPGAEYDALQKNVNSFRNMPKGIKEITLGKPLMFSHESMENLCTQLNNNLPKEISKNDALIYMGHGTHHQANIYYPAMQYYMWQKNKNHYLATVEGYPSLDEVIKYLKEKKTKKVYLLPFMTIAGDHARNDMAGTDSDSWKSILEAKGYKVKSILTGMADHNGVVKIWVDSIEESLEKLD